MSSKGTQPRTHLCPSPKLPSQPGYQTTLTRVPRAMCPCWFEMGFSRILFHQNFQIYWHKGVHNILTFKIFLNVYRIVEMSFSSFLRFVIYVYLFINLVMEFSPCYFFWSVCVCVCVYSLLLFSMNTQIIEFSLFSGSPAGASGKESACLCRKPKRCGFSPWFGKIPWRRAWQLTLIFLPGESHGVQGVAKNQTEAN